MPRTRTTRSTAATPAAAAPANTHSTQTSPYFRPASQDSEPQPEAASEAAAAISYPALSFGATESSAIHYPTDRLERANAMRAAPEVDAKGRKKPSKVSEFDFKVYDALLKVPKGKLTTYAALAKSIQAHPRAVGQALRRNPYAPYVPCHRVIASDHKLGGFNGATGQCAMTMRKHALLVAEGAIVSPPAGKAADGSKDVKVQVVPDGMFDWSA